MIYPQQFESKIGFDRIREIVENRCVSETGRSLISEIGFSIDHEEITTRLSEITEYLRFLDLSDQIPSLDVPDIREELGALRPLGTFPEAEFLGALRLNLISYLGFQEAIRKINTDDNRLPLLQQIVGPQTIDESLISGIEHIVDERNHVRDRASAELASIRQRQQRLTQQISRIIHAALGKAIQEGYVSKDNQLTIRNGRMVIPVPAQNKRKIKGFVHDESASGHTVFVEPAESFEMNNELSDLHYEEKREIVRILTVFADYIRPDLDTLRQINEILGILDLTRAKAMFSKDIKATQPTINTNGYLSLKKAVHPLLFLAFREQKREVVPQTFIIDDDQHVLMISGPNAGGKSVFLKMIGLLQYMIQCGLHVPVAADSSFCIFHKIFLEIGDEQSIENDLSTYSSHLRNLNVFLRHADEHSLFLIDEFGTGTEPQIGGAIAEAVLETLALRRAKGVVTTHYANLKSFASMHPGFINGAMMFDSEEIKPLYRLKIGEPGSSYAFEIAEKLGFPEEVIQSARQRAGSKNIIYDKQLRDVEIERIHLENNAAELEEKQKKVDSLIAHYEKLKEGADRLRKEQEKAQKQMLDKAKEEAAQLVDKARKDIEKTIQLIRESSADKAITKEVRKKLEEEYPETETMKKEAAATALLVEEEANTFVTGDIVRVSGYETAGEIMEVSNNKALVSFGGLYSRVPLTDLVKAEKMTRREQRSNLAERMLERQAAYATELDIRGQRADEAHAAVQSFLDEATMIGIRELTIIHGKGNGVLRQITRDLLKATNEVEWFGDGHADRSGTGVTHIKLSYE
ncbi:MAG: Smr/MutS family protein [Bacteroidetes bacterium]|nr:Smr/MutS family protein [Bacteroidota bacterium]